MRRYLSHTFELEVLFRFLLTTAYVDTGLPGISVSKGIKSGFQTALNITVK